MSRALVAIAAMLLCAAAVARDWYWRPAGAAYGAGDGTSYANAWSGTDAIRWDAMADGDTLYVCGVHDGGSPKDRALGAARSGITISGRCRDGRGKPDDGVVVGASARFDSWSSGPDANGVWTHYGITQGPPAYAMNERHERVLLSPGHLTTRTPCNSFHDSGVAVSYKPCMPAGAAATPTLYLAQVGGLFSGLSTFIAATDIHDLTVRGLQLYLYYNTFQFHGGRRIVIDDVVMGINSFANEFVHLDGLVKGLTLRNSVLCDGANGIYGFAHAGGGDLAPDAHRQDDVTIEGNRFCQLRANTDSHGVALQNGDGWIVRDNRFEDIEGTAITLYLFAAGGRPGGRTFRNHLIEGNTITRIRAFPQIAGAVHATWQRGIEITGDVSCRRAKDDMRNIVIRGNVLSDIAKGGIYVQAPQTTDGMPAVSVLDNRIENVRDDRSGFGIMWSDRLPPGCREDADFPAASVLIAGNTIAGARYLVAVYTGTAASQSVNFADLSQVALRQNRYARKGYVMWPASAAEPKRGRSACVDRGGIWDVVDRSCSFDADALEGLRSYSGREQGSAVAQ